MIEPTSLSTPQSANVPDAPSSENLQPVKQEDSWLQAIPLLTSTSSKVKEETKDVPLYTEPSSCENLPNSNSDQVAQHENEQIVEGQFEYEFSCLFDGALCFVHLVDTTDVSACERVVHKPVTPADITYSSTTGNGFIVDEPFKYTFTKNPYRKTWTTHADIRAGVEYENRVARRTPKHVKTAEDILASL